MNVEAAVDGPAAALKVVGKGRFISWCGACGAMVRSFSRWPRFFCSIRCRADSSRKTDLKSYRTVQVGGRNQRVHRIRAEAALGRRLPPGVQVHHVDGTKGDTSQLVICQDQAYHALLHVRTRVFQAGGDPDTMRMCCQCKRPLLVEAFYGRRTGPTITNVCRECSILNSARRAERRRNGQPTKVAK